MRKLMLREVKWLAGGHTAGTVQSWYWNSVLTAGTNLLTTMLSTSLHPVKLFQSAIKGVLRDQWVHLLVIPERFFKTTMCYRDTRSFTGNEIASWLFHIALPTLQMPWEWGALPFPSLKSLCWCLHSRGAPNTLKCSSEFVPSVKSEEPKLIQLLCIINVAEINISVECQRSSTAACPLE